MAEKARLTYLAYSGGVQSQVLIEMVLRGDLARPENFIVLTANPGMENSESRAFVDRTHARCKEAGIPFIRAQGPNLFEDFTSLRNTKTHLDTPPLWTRDRKTGHLGALLQKCTQVYKIEPMRRALRGYIWWKWNYGMTRKTGLPPTDGWIGFAADEVSRIKPRKKRDPKFITLRYPLIELGMNRLKIEGYYLKHGIQKPPRSVCNACFANGLAYYRDMADNRPDDFEQACKFDDGIRDLRKWGVKDECFVSSTLLPLRELERLDFEVGESTKKHRCNSGHCFI